MTDLIYLLAALFFLLLNAFFVLAEFAAVKVRFTRLEELAAKGVTRAKIAKEISKDLEAYLSTAQLGITIASIGLGWVGEPAVGHLVTPLFALFGLTLTPAATHTLSIGLAFALITGFHVVIGELVPKNMAIRLPESSALWIAAPFKFFHSVFFVPMWLLNESANLVLRALRIKANQEETVHSDEELRMILGQSQEHGRISLGRLMMFEHLFDFGKTRVKEVMTPRASISFIDTALPWEQNLKLIREKQLSRYPILTRDGAIDGYAHFKDMAVCFIAGNGPVKPELAAIKRPLYEISEEISVERALREFQEKRIQLALAKNPKGEVTGLLTMEDIVEELTGEIRDEFDQPPKMLLSNLLVRHSCVLDLQEPGRFEAIEEVLNKLHEASPSFDKDEALKALIKRETNFSTALGHQTAFPHARLASLSRPLLAIGKSREGIHFPSPDNQPVKVLFLILTPFNEPTLQLNILSQLSGLISNVTLRKRLLSAKTPDALMDVIHTFENKVMK
ncbi:MAG: CNNM domain-containing protein [Elusimicrobiales bacterium]|nr:CNNM domain-containing protein [Elusimicrobiales bacterium]